MDPADLPRAIRLADGGDVDLASLVGERHPLSDWRDAFAALVERRSLKVVVEPQADSAEAA
jgi:threonine dehydrogenase-like Zn-dependent dehydrogenase